MKRHETIARLHHLGCYRGILFVAGAVVLRGERILHEGTEHFGYVDGDACMVVDLANAHRQGPRSRTSHQRLCRWSALPDHPARDPRKDERSCAAIVWPTPSGHWTMM